MDKALNYIALARKAGRIELGEEPVGAAARAQHARLVVVASDASDHTWRRAKSFVAGTQQQCLKVLALAFVKALGNPEKYTEVLENLDKRTQRIRQHQKEEKAHQRNKAMGRTRRVSGKKKEV